MNSASSRVPSEIGFLLIKLIQICTCTCALLTLAREFDPDWKRRRLFSGARSGCGAVGSRNGRRSSSSVFFLLGCGGCVRDLKTNWTHSPSPFGGSAAESRFTGECFCDLPVYYIRSSLSSLGRGRSHLSRNKLDEFCLRTRHFIIWVNQKQWC